MAWCIPQLIQPSRTGRRSQQLHLPSSKLSLPVWLWQSFLSCFLWLSAAWRLWQTTVQTFSVEPSRKTRSRLSLFYQKLRKKLSVPSPECCPGILDQCAVKVLTNLSKFLQNFQIPLGTKLLVLDNNPVIFYTNRQVGTRSWSLWEESFWLLFKFVI